MPKPKKLLKLSCEDLLQLSFFYKHSNKIRKFSLCYFIQTMEGDAATELEVQDFDLANALNVVFVQNLFINFFSKETAFVELEIYQFSGNEMIHRDKYYVTPPILGVAESDTQVSYNGTYSAQFRQKQAGMPVTQLGRIRLHNFYVSRSLPNPKIILENRLFQDKLKIELEDQKSLNLKFYGVTRNQGINLDAEGCYVEERVL